METPCRNASKQYFLGGKPDIEKNVHCSNANRQVAVLNKTHIGQDGDTEQTRYLIAFTCNLLSLR